MLPSIRDVRSSYVAGHQQEATKPNSYNISVISDYIKDSYYSNLPEQSESAPPPPVVYDCYDEPNRNEIAEVLALLEAKAACEFLGGAIDSCEKVHDGLVGGTEWSRADGAVHLLHSLSPHQTEVVESSESESPRPPDVVDNHVEPNLYRFIPLIFSAEQATEEEVLTITHTNCSRMGLNRGIYSVANTATIKAAMGAVGDARDSVRFPSLLAAGNLPPPFLTLSQPHDEADPDFGSCQDKELLDHLEGVLDTESVVVKRGQHIVPLKGKSVFVRADFNAPLDAGSGSVVDSPSPSMQMKRAQRNRPPNSCHVHCASPLCSTAHASTPPSDLCAAAWCPLENIKMSSCDAPHACPPLYYGYGDGSPMAHLRRVRVGWGASARVPMAMVVDNFSFACTRATMGEPVEVAGFDHSPFSLPDQLSYLTPSHQLTCGILTEMSLFFKLCVDLYCAIPADLCESVTQGDIPVGEDDPPDNPTRFILPTDAPNAPARTNSGVVDDSVFVIAKLTGYDE